MDGDSGLGQLALIFLLYQKESPAFVWPGFVSHYRPYQDCRATFLLFSMLLLIYHCWAIDRMLLTA